MKSIQSWESKVSLVPLKDGLIRKEKTKKMAANLLYCKSTIKATIFGWATIEEPKTVISMKIFQRMTNRSMDGTSAGLSKVYTTFLPLLTLSWKRLDNQRSTISVRQVELKSCFMA